MWHAVFTVKRTGQESGDELCEIFQMLAVSAVKILNNVCKLFELLETTPDPYRGFAPDCVTFPWPLITSFIAAVDDTLTWGGGRAVERDSATWLAEAVTYFGVLTHLYTYITFRRLVGPFVTLPISSISRNAITAEYNAELS